MCMIAHFVTQLSKLPSQQKSVVYIHYFYLHLIQTKINVHTHFCATKNGSSGLFPWLNDNPMFKLKDLSHSIFSMLAYSEI